MVPVAFCLAPSSTAYFFVYSFCHIFWVCGLFCRLQDPISSCSIVFPLGGEVWSIGLYPYPLDLGFDCWIKQKPPLDIQGSFPLSSMVVTALSEVRYAPGWWRRGPIPFLHCDSDLCPRQIGLEDSQWERSD